MLYSVVDAFQRLGLPGIRNDDFFDRLSRRYSMIVLGISFIIVTSTHFVGDPIHCFTKLVDSEHKIDYINWVCWISSSYYLPFEKPLPNRDQPRPERMSVTQRRCREQLAGFFCLFQSLLSMGPFHSVYHDGSLLRSWFHLEKDEQKLWHR